MEQKWWEPLPKPRSFKEVFKTNVEERIKRRLDILSDTEDLENQASELAYKLRNDERQKWAINYLERVVPVEKQPIWDY